MRASRRKIVASTISIFIITLGILYLYGLYNPSIPILMYHHINEHRGDLTTIAPSDFERQMSYIKDNFTTIHLGELLSYIDRGKRFPPKACVITFDDGYYDNFVYAYPVLKKYKLKATIFVISSRIGEKRYSHEIKDNFSANLEGAIMCSTATPTREARGAGNFLTWDELREMEERGLIDIQSHTLTHARYFASSVIRDFNSGRFPWWLSHASGGDVRLGIPIYEDQKSLLCRRYFDDRLLRNYLSQYVGERGGEKFFTSRKNEEWFNELFSITEEYRTKHRSLKGHFETEAERKTRVRDELSLSKSEIEERLKKEILFIAWPWGKYNEEVIDMARSVGYCGAVTAEKGSNTFRDDPMYLKRFDIKTGNLAWFKARLFMYKHSIIARVYPAIRGK